MRVVAASVCATVVLAMTPTSSSMAVPQHGGTGSSASASLGAVVPSGVKVKGKVTGRVLMRGSKWGPLTVITSVKKAADGSPVSAHLLVVDRQGRVHLRRDWDWGWAALKPNKPATDATGNVFLRYNPGRYDGVIVLRAEGRRIENFGSLPPNDDFSGSGPFGYYARTVPDPTRAGVLAIEQSSNDCTPTCAEGRTTTSLYVWNGSEYVLSN